MRELIDKNASTAMPQAEFACLFEEKTATYDSLREQSDALEVQKRGRAMRLKKMEL